ncbi:low temperature requirement protein LtrA [Micromonospora palomenae]|uniref:Low temperature requirement protein LtrA n=1 Tax=Micromonospora palomenae TaxID=1461247 RepID=A0A561VFQ3_9ACTN|nr:low temperature requirement protein A [Micromonospora palomenae]TWG10415.1 low temperature requirement protein LtrA [Micromonospora palomenae]
MGAADRRPGAAGGGQRWSRGVRPGAPGSRTTRLELYYDVVFVFAFLTVTTVTSSRPSVANLIGCLLVLSLLWWCWTGFATVGNAVRTDQGVLPLIGFVTLAATFLLALSMPTAFVDRPGGLNGPLVFAGCYFVVRMSQLSVLGWVEWPDPARRRRWLLLASPPVIATALLVTAALVPHRVADGTVEGWLRLLLWSSAVLVEYGAGVLLRGAYWAVGSAGHWAERHALIVLVALGETVIALGFGTRFLTELPLTWPVMVAAVLGIAVVSALWWAYFDTLALAMEQALHGTREPAARARLARDVYTYLHLPLIAGIIFVALGIKDLLSEGADPSTPAWGEPLGGFWVLVLHGGVAVYLLGLAGLGWRTWGEVRWVPLATVVLLAALGPLSSRVPELVALGLLALVGVASTGAQTMVDGPRRRRTRQVALAEQEASEAEQSRWRGEHL